MEKLDIIIPAYNEQDTIGGIIKEIRGVLGSSCRILVVDDASTDKTGETALANGAEVIRHPYRIGNGAAVKTGLRQAKGDIAVFMDGDGQHLPREIPLLLSQMENFDMVIGARDFSGFSSRNIANRAYNLFASYITRFKIRDLTSGFRAVKREKALKFVYLLPNGFSYPTTITLSFLKTGRTIKYVPISSKKRKEGRSKINLLEDGVRFFLIIVRIATFFSPLRVFLPVSIFFFACGLLNYLHTYFTSGRFTNMSVLLFITSLIIFMLGLISEQISQLRMDRTE
ncbi:MAG: glycosyltransferase family 2 protein [Candidatus Omnitrophica bacterium]|nr:glycosyltransferase family 2 protein [Candidatus Omnitrophota bacterium]